MPSMWEYLDNSGSNQSKYFANIVRCWNCLIRFWIMSHKMPQKLITGTFLAVQWLSHWITLKDEWVKSLLEKLRSCMLWGAVKKKKKKTITKFLKQILKIENFIKDVKEPNESYKTENYHNQNKKSIKYTQE